MPRYYFHLVQGGVHFDDPEGQLLQDADEAWEAARAAALSLMEAVGAGDWASCHFEVADNANQVILEFPFREAIRPVEESN